MEFKNPDYATLKTAIMKLLDEQKKTGKYRKLRFTFSEEVDIPISYRKSVKRTEMDLRTFISSQGDVGYTNYSNGRRGHFLTRLPISKIIRIENVPDKTDEYWEKESRRALAAFHENAWVSIAKKIMDNPLYIKEHFDGYKPVDIRKKFHPSVLEQIKIAFETGKDYSYKSYGKKRDLSVDVKVQEDGSIMAWFSSEFSGCGNGSYYILINPTTAAFREDD